MIGAETRRKTLVQIHDLREKWAPVKAAADAMAAGDGSEAHLGVVLGQNMAVLASAKLLVSELVGQYSNPFEMVQADSLLIDIAGRQRMLTQKMSKESCMLANQSTDGETADALRGTMDIFEKALFASPQRHARGGNQGPADGGNRGRAGNGHRRLGTREAYARSDAWRAQRLTATSMWQSFTASTPPWPT